MEACDIWSNQTSCIAQPCSVGNELRELNEGEFTMVDQIIFLAACLCAIAYFSNREDGPHSLDQDSKDTSKQSESLDIPEIAS